MEQMNSPRLKETVFADLDVFDDRIAVTELWRWLESRRLTRDELEPYMSFRADRYVRNLIHAGPAFQALVLCWRNGQRSPIHDHPGSNCAVKVIQGTATETLFDRAANGMIFPVQSRQLEPGFICASHDDDIHQMSNLQADGADLVTLHLYSPPLMSMNMYSLLDDSCSPFLDPVNDNFVAGDGI
jgi:cysteine dioxygenase